MSTKESFKFRITASCTVHEYILTTRILVAFTWDEVVDDCGWVRVISQVLRAHKELQCHENLSISFVCRWWNWVARIERKKRKIRKKSLVMVNPGEGCNWLSFCDLDNLLKNDNTHCSTTKLSSHLEGSVFWARVASSRRNMNCHFMHSLPNL